MSKLSTVRPKALKPTLSDEKRRTVKPNSADNLSSKKNSKLQTLSNENIPRKSGITSQSSHRKGLRAKKI